MNEACPKCGGNHRIEIKAYWWMRFVPNSVLYQCNDCLKSYLSVPAQMDAHQGKVRQA